MQPISRHPFPYPMISYFNPFQLSFVEQNLDDISLAIDAHSLCFVPFSLCLLYLSQAPVGLGDEIIQDHRCLFDRNLKSTMRMLLPPVLRDIRSEKYRRKFRQDPLIKQGQSRTGNLERDDLVWESCPIVLPSLSSTVHCVHMESEISSCEAMKGCIWDVVWYFMSIVVPNEVEIDRARRRSDVFR